MCTTCIENVNYNYDNNNNQKCINITFMFKLRLFAPVCGAQ